VTRVYWDSMLFIYLLEKHPVYGRQVMRLYDEMLDRNHTLCTSVFTIGEVLTGPRKRNDTAGLRGIQNFFASDEVEILPISRDVMDKYSILRAGTKVRQADALQLATASAASVNVFVTNDRDLRALHAPGLPVVIGLDGKVF
jgi:predicted nucleic acid-binding protein